MAESSACLKLAAGADNLDAHYVQTNKIFNLVIRLHLDHDLAHDELINVSAEFSDIRREFGVLAGQPAKWWQTNLEKCAIAALFLEAAFYLDIGGRQEADKGMRRLFIAHLLNSRFGGNEASETYGEILCAVREKAVRNIIALAMRRDPEAQIEFQNLMRVEHAWAVEVAEVCLGLMKIAPKLRESKVLALLGEKR